METVKNTLKSATGKEQKSQFEQGPQQHLLIQRNAILTTPHLGHEVPISHQDAPGKQKDMVGPDPVNDQLPTSDGGYQPYKAAGKLAGKKAMITGGDSGIGRAIAILYAMEGAESTIVYLPQEEKDAQKTRELVLEKGGKVHLLQADLKHHQECKKVVDQALAAMGRINILVLNHGTQMMRETIAELSEYVPPPYSLIKNPYTNRSAENNGSTLLP